jgi:hypothetical protein
MTPIKRYFHFTFMHLSDFFSFSSFFPSKYFAVNKIETLIKHEKTVLKQKKELGMITDMMTDLKSF